MNNIFVEIRAAEGGDDAKLLVNDLYKVYKKLCNRLNLNIENSEVADGMIRLTISGKNAYKHFINESGGHRWQRIPPTERRDRVHTSTITVAVLQSLEEKRNVIDKKDVIETFMRGSGKGGQHRNKTSTACRLTHKPTGIQVRVESERSQSQNREAAWKLLEEKLSKINEKKSYELITSNVKSQVGSGQRGDKRRTYREKDDCVTDDISGKKASYKRVMNGELELLWADS